MRSVIPRCARLACALLTAAPVLATPAPLVSIPPGQLRPLVPSLEPAKPIEVGAFRLERHAVTNTDFLAFVKAQPGWRRDRVKPLFAGPEFLGHWSAPLEVDGAHARAPVTRVSYFAARAYCGWRDRRLPTVAEWEYVAAASASHADARAHPGFDKQVLDWTRKAAPEVPRAVESAGPNFYGVHDMHGLVWEWTSDFNSELVATELGGDASLVRNLFCGDHGSVVSDPADYAAFMRVAFRGSLEASYTVANLGFRCAADEDEP